ncbi:hypothetical protein K7432_014273, partial [Basidiobolus ranarum]
MEEVQQLLTKALVSQEDGVYEDAYFLYLHALEVASNILKSVVFENQVIIKKPRLVNHLFESCQKSVAGAQAIAQSHLMNINTQRLASPLSPQPLSSSPQQSLDEEVEVLTYQTCTPRKRTVRTKHLKRLAIVHDDFQPLPVFSDE